MEQNGRHGREWERVGCAGQGMGIMREHSAEAGGDTRGSGRGLAAGSWVEVLGR
jgi:hypothetical protein